jgi:hypothetical protein
VQVPDNIRKSVVFLGSNQEGKFYPRGTAFLVSYPSAVDERFSTIYLVTARHVITRTSYADDEGLVRIRYNKKFGGTDFANTPTSVWLDHPNVVEDVDVLVAPVLFNFQAVDAIAIPISIFMEPHLMKAHSYGLGDEFFLTGLFSRRVGNDRNIPIIRVGTIAALREEVIATGEGRQDVYLLEVRSTGGLSGSPIFAYIGPVRHGSTGVVIGGSSQYYLLGVVSGHWNHDSDIAPADDSRLDDAEPLNTGIAFATPAEKIREILDRPDLQAMRDENDAKLRSRDLSAPSQSTEA